MLRIPVYVTDVVEIVVTPSATIPVSVSPTNQCLLVSSICGVIPSAPFIISAVVVPELSITVMVAPVSV